MTMSNASSFGDLHPNGWPADDGTGSCSEVECQPLPRG